ncbi:sugar ABC transporter permease [Litorilinea aerophila]|uniref:carbohydrate ABC transporter permease n=1 Tax=Litorilinea aerophila TaxID=1204385 RepID=UPI001476EAE7|nr:sugar ABC transporter permease [Litorilinea aerophila]MCC9075029.1 sugar ABC transporter permease [Litorilinea aerophila]
MTAITHWIHRLSPQTLAGRRTLVGYIFISPFILGFLLWFLLPAVTALWLAVNDWNLIRPPRFVGADNFLKMGTDRLFWQSLKVTTVFSIISVPVGLVLSFLLALLMNTKVRGIAFFRTVYYLPSIVPAVASAVLWAWILNTEFGLLNVLLQALGLPKVPWLQDPEWALPALILMSLWGLGGSMIIYLAGLQGIPETYYEAARIDGAGRWAQLRHITIPLMSPIIFFNLIMGIIGSFQIFTAGYLVTNGGPQNATLFYVLYLYRNGFEYLDMGYAAALAWILFFIILALTLFVFKYVGRMVHYEISP